MRLSLCSTSAASWAHVCSLSLVGVDEVRGDAGRAIAFPTPEATDEMTSDIAHALRSDVKYLPGHDWDDEGVCQTLSERCWP